MTTYRYRVTFNYEEIDALMFTLGLTLMHCQKEWNIERRAPYWAHIHSIKEVIEKIHNNVIEKDNELPSYLIDFDDGETIMLDFAKELTIKHCQEKIQQGEEKPYKEYIELINGFSKRLYKDTKQTSGSNSSGIWIDLTDNDQ